MVNQAFVCAEKQPSPRRSIQMNHTLSEINMPTKASLASLGPARGGRVRNQGHGIRRMDLPSSPARSVYLGGK